MIKKILFPYDEIRDIQDKLIKEIVECLEKGKSIIAHAPTGLGKTAAALAPALAYAINNNKTVFFLTSRHTQHKIAIETLKQIKHKHGSDFVITDIIGKKHMCLQPGVETLYTGEFFEYCKALKEDGRCDFFSNTMSSNKLTMRATQLINELTVDGTNSSKEIIDECMACNDQLCPYEVSHQLAKNARVIIADYYYIFNPFIQEPFFKRINKTLQDSIIIVDEGHNLPDRIRELLTTRLSLNIVERAIKEAKKMKYNETAYTLNKIREAVLEFGDELSYDEQEKLITKDAFMKKINAIDNYEKIVDDLEFIGDEIREQKKRSYIGSIAEFLKRWEGGDDGFMRYVKFDKDGRDNILISYRCLDPAVLTREVMNQAYSVIMMSGTLTPTYMYKDLLGFNDINVVEKEYGSPFPEENRLNLIIPETSTKYTARNEQQFKRIAEISADIANSIKGNTALFFPSYYVKAYIEKYFKTLYEKSVFSEVKGMTTEEKHNMIENFKKYKDMGSALLAVASGSYGEGIDLPGDFLKCVIVVGLPLQKPDLETKELINYYDEKFKRGWDYGYLFPAFNKTLQNAGRCIRSKDDKGIVVFLDERYAWNNYFRCFPKDMKIKITKNYKAEIVDFFW